MPPHSTSWRFILILSSHLCPVISNEELWRRAGEIEISIQIKRRKWNWIGHTLRKGHDTIEREVLDWNPQGQRKRWRPKRTWRRSVHSEVLGEGKSWGEVKQLARNRIRWRLLLTPYVPKGTIGYDNDDDLCLGLPSSLFPSGLPTKTL